MKIEVNEIDNIYFGICKQLICAPKVGNTRELLNVKLQLNDITNNIVSIRNISPSYLFGELIWYFTGRNDTAFISKFAKFWEGISDDGKTANSAYGYLIQKAFGFDQVQKVIDILKADPNSRRAKININTPRENVDTTKDEPCTMFLQFMIRNGKLNCTAVMRSNDIWFGLPYDVAFFTELQKCIADYLGVGYGTYTHYACSLHLYDRDFEKVFSILRNPISKPINFDREMFHANINWLAKELELRLQYPNIMADKEYLIFLLKVLGIYKEEKNENKVN